MKLKHTPGPWMEGNDDRKKCRGSNYCGSADKDIFAMVRVLSTNEESTHDGEEYEANRRLILSAPDMLKRDIEFKQVLNELSDSVRKGDITDTVWLIDHIRNVFDFTPDEAAIGCKWEGV